MITSEKARKETLRMANAIEVNGGNERRELEEILDYLNKYFTQQEIVIKLLDLYRKADKIRKEMYESVVQGRIETLMKLSILNQEEIDKLEIELK